MLRLAMTLYTIIGSTLAGICVIIALTTGNDTLQPLLVAAAIGAALGLPAALYIAKQLRAA